LSVFKLLSFVTQEQYLLPPVYKRLLLCSVQQVIELLAYSTAVTTGVQACSPLRTDTRWHVESS